MMLLSSKEANRNLVRNIDYIKAFYDLKTDRAFAEKIGVSPATIVGIRREGKIPAIYPFFKGLMDWTGYTFEELMNIDMEEHEKRADVDYPEVDYEMHKYLGLYILYYFRTQSFKGRETKDDANALEYGLLGVYRDPGSQRAECRAVMGLGREEAEKRYERCMEQKGRKKALKKNFQSILVDFPEKVSIYEGNIKLTHGHIFITCSSGIRDVFSMIIHRPDTAKQRYIGGLGAVVSVSKGRDSCPCVQFIGISRYLLTASSEEIAKHILLGYPSIKPGEELNQIVEQMNMLIRDYEEHTLAGGSHMETDLAEQIRMQIIIANMSTMINRIVERNLFRVVKISATDDDDWYHFCKQYNQYGEDV